MDEIKNMQTFYLNALAHQSVLWSAQASIIMILCNVFTIFGARGTIQVKTAGASLLGITLPELIATTSLGHIIGAGVILGLRGSGVAI